MRIRFWAWSAIVMFTGCSAADPKLKKEDVQLEELQQSAAVKTCLSLSKKSASSLALQDGEVTYESHIKELLNNNCVSCHGAGGSSPRLDTRTSAKANAAAILSSMQKTDASVMPPSGALAAMQIQLVQTWIAAGTPDGTATVGTPAASDESGGVETSENQSDQSTSESGGASQSPSGAEANSSVSEDQRQSCAKVASIDECREQGFLWTGDRCLPLERVDCSIESLVMAFGRVDTDVGPSLVLPEGSGELQVEGCAQQKVATGGKSTVMMPVAVVYFVDPLGQVIYRTLTVETPK